MQFVGSALLSSLLVLILSALFFSNEKFEGYHSIQKHSNGARTRDQIVHVAGTQKKIMFIPFYIL